MRRLEALIGGEHDLHEVARELRSDVRALGASATGGFQITCSDESEHECSEAFQRGFALETLPRLKYGERVPFRIANPGARYEWGSVRIAEDHFATSEARRGFLAMVVKINGHVAHAPAGAPGKRFGVLERYGADSVYCGAVHAALGEATLPFVESLRDDLRTEGRDRVAALHAVAAAGDGREALFGALAAARIQARKCVLDIQDHAPAAPTVYVVLHGVTLNRAGPDREVLGGYYVLDHRGPRREERYVGLEDDPTSYEVATEDGRVRVRDARASAGRAVRDHRRLARERLQALPVAQRDLGASARDLLGEAEPKHAARGAVNRALLKMLLGAAASVAPLASALLLVAEGAAEIHHALGLQHADGEQAQARSAREVLAAVQAQVHRLPADVAQRVIAGLRRIDGPAPAAGVHPGGG